MKRPHTFHKAMSIDKIKSSISILQLAENLGLSPKKQSNKIYKANCCFHKETKPSLTFYPETNTFKCYGCGKFGDQINFYAECKGITNKEAIKELARDKGIKFTSNIKKHRPKKSKKKSQPDYSRLYEALQGFSKGISEKVLKYLTGPNRGLTRETINKFKIFEIKDYKKTKSFLLNEFSKEELKSAGLLTANNRFVFTKNRIVIPIIDNGKTVTLTARFFDNGITDPEQLKITTYTYPKYKNLPGIADRLFNTDTLQQASPGDKVFLCEGPFDTMIAEQNGLTAVGLLGLNNCNKTILRRLKDYELFICMDNHTEGNKQSYVIADTFREVAKKEAKINKLKPGIKDLTEYFTQKGEGK